MITTSLNSSIIDLDKQPITWRNGLVSWATANLKRLIKLDDGFSTCLPKSLAPKIHDLQIMLLHWLRSHAGLEMDLSAKAKAILQDRELNEALHDIRRDIEKMKPAEGGPVIPELQLLMSAVRAPELINAPENTCVEQVTAISDHYLQRLANGSVSLSL